MNRIKSLIARLGPIVVILAISLSVWLWEMSVFGANDLVGQGRQALDSDKVDDAIAIFEKALAADANDPAALAWLGSAQVRKARTAPLFEAPGWVKKGFNTMDEAVDRFPDAFVVYMVRGITALRVPDMFRKTPVAVKDLGTVTAMKDKTPGAVPDSVMPSVYLNLGLALKKNGQSAEARAAWEKARKLYPSAPESEAIEKELKRLGAGADTHPASPSTASRPARFDSLVRNDFFAGMNGDETRFARAMKLCEDALLREPRDAEAMVWHGLGLVFLGGRAFAASDFEKGGELFGRGLKEMDAAVQLAPDRIGVRVPRGSVLLQAARGVPSVEQARALAATAAGDFERATEIHGRSFERLSGHSRGELLSGLAEGWDRAGNADKARPYLEAMVKDLSGTPYATKAQAWLDGGAPRPNGGALSCTTGCHRK